MYQKKGLIPLPYTVSMLPKNLQVVSFDPEWREIYLGTLRREGFAAVCPHDVPTASKVDIVYGTKAEEVMTSTVAVTAAKWCPMDNCTVLVLGSQAGVRLFDWGGSTQIYDYDFAENGIGVDDRLVAGGAARGVAAVGPSFIAVGTHTGTVVVFEVSSDSDGFVCRVIDSQRNHWHPIADLASTTVTGPNSVKDILVSGDETGLLNVWTLGQKPGDGIVHRTKIDSHADCPVTALALWNKFGQGVIIGGYGSGLLRMFSAASGSILCEVSAHAGWVTGMDLASQSGLMVTCSEDGFVRVWQLSARQGQGDSAGSDKILQHAYSYPVADCLPTGVKFLDPKGVRFAVASYDSNKIQCFSS